MATEIAFIILLIIRVSGVIYLISFDAAADIILLPASASITDLEETLNPSSYPSSTSKSA